MKPLLTLLITATIFVSGAGVAVAQIPDTFERPAITEGTIAPNQGFVPCSGTNCSACDFVVMANTIIKWLIGISFLFFAVLAVMAGFKLVTSGSNPGARSDAKQSFTNAFIGLLIIMAAWLLIDTLLRGVLDGGNGEITGYGPWSKVQCSRQAQPEINDLGFATDLQYWPGDAQTDPNANRPTGAMPTGCSGSSCTALTTPCTNGCSVAPAIASRINQFHADAGVSGARVTEAMPPSRTHRSPCHSNGTCIDYSKQGGMSASEVLQVINAAYRNNLRPIYEVQTQAQKNALVSGGVPAANVLVLGGHISAPHFSIYGY